MSRIASFNATTFIYDPNMPQFRNPQIRAFRFSGEDSSELFFAPSYSELTDRSKQFPYHGITFAGGDSGLLFVGLHEMGHVATRFVPGIDREEIAHDFARLLFPTRLPGTDVNIEDIQW